MTDQLIADLGQIKTLRVISRTSAMQYKGQHKPIAQIARELNVDAVVQGTVLKSGSLVRITAQLIQAPLDRHLWAKSYEGDLHDILSLQDNVASAIAQEIQAAVTPQEQALLTSAHPVNPEAYEDYMQGRYFWNKRDDGALERAIEYFQKATSIDSNYAPAYAGLAQTYVLLAGNTGPKDEFVAAGKKSATQALFLDPNLSEAQMRLVASSIRAMRWQAGPRSSNQRNGELSCISSSPKQALRSRPTCTTFTRWERGRHQAACSSTSAASLGSP
jgi:hypothetical protein